MPVDVKVYVSENGRVDFAELVSSGRNAQLANAAVFAARRWTFTPARLDGENIPGEVILHFRFLPPPRAD
jgi:TonB family protein